MFLHSSSLSRSSSGERVRLLGIGFIGALTIGFVPFTAVILLGFFSVVVVGALPDRFSTLGRRRARVKRVNADRLEPRSDSLILFSKGVTLGDLSVGVKGGEDLPDVLHAHVGRETFENDLARPRIDNHQTFFRRVGFGAARELRRLTGRTLNSLSALKRSDPWSKSSHFDIGHGD